jgi:hypothetical protein
MCQYCFYQVTRLASQGHTWVTKWDLVIEMNLMCICLHVASGPGCLLCRMELSLWSHCLEC